MTGSGRGIFSGMVAAAAIGLLFPVGSTFAQTPKPGASTPAPAAPATAAVAPSKAVESFMEKYASAFRGCDTQALMALMDRRFTGFGSRGSLAKGADLKDFESQCQQGVKFDLTFRPLAITEAGEVQIVAVLAQGLITQASGRVSPVQMRVSWVLSKAEGGLALLHSHMSSYTQIRG